MSCTSTYSSPLPLHKFKIKLSSLKRQGRRLQITCHRVRMSGPGSVLSTSSERTIWLKPWRSLNFTVTCCWLASALFSPWSEYWHTLVHEHAFITVPIHFSCLTGNLIQVCRRQCQHSSGQRLVSSRRFLNWKLLVLLLYNSLQSFWQIESEKPFIQVFPLFFRYQISCVLNIARSMESYAGQTRLAQSTIGYAIFFHWLPKFIFKNAYLLLYRH